MKWAKLLHLLLLCKRQYDGFLASLSKLDLIFLQKSSAKVAKFCRFCSRTTFYFYLFYFFLSSVSSLYLLLLVVLLRDGVTQDVQETDVSRWAGRVPKHLQPKPDNLMSANGSHTLARTCQSLSRSRVSHCVEKARSCTTSLSHPEALLANHGGEEQRETGRGAS